jgi:hypothetical protein
LDLADSACVVAFVVDTPTFAVLSISLPFSNSLPVSPSALGVSLFLPLCFRFFELFPVSSSFSSRLFELFAVSFFFSFRLFAVSFFFSFRLFAVSSSFSFRLFAVSSSFSFRLFAVSSSFSFRLFAVSFFFSFPLFAFLPVAIGELISVFSATVTAKLYNMKQELVNK